LDGVGYKAIFYSDSENGFSKIGRWFFLSSRVWEK
jgi:hypothetical protein